MKLAQIQSQIFVYVIAIVVVSMILMFGYNAVKDFGQRAEEVALIQFEKDMTATFHTISSSYGKIEIKKVEVPGGFDTVCFVEAPIAQNYQNLVFNGTSYPIILDSVKSNTEKNLFLVGGLNIESFDIGNILIQQVPGEFPGFICFKSKQGRVEFKLFGKGDHVLVTTAD